METENRIFRIDAQLEYVEITADEIDKYRGGDTMHFIEIFYNPELYKYEYTYLKFKAYDMFFKPSCLKVGNIRAMGTRKNTWANKWDELRNYSISNQADFWEIGPGQHRATYEILIQDVNQKNRLLSFSRPNKNLTKNALAPIMKCLEEMKELNNWGTWKAFDMANELEELKSDNEKIITINDDLEKENKELKRIFSKLARESKAINRLGKLMQSDNFLNRIEKKK